MGPLHRQFDCEVCSAAKRRPGTPSPAYGVGALAGWMFWLTWKALSGS